MSVCCLKFNIICREGILLCLCKSVQCKNPRDALNSAYPIQRIQQQNNRHGNLNRSLFPKKTHMYLCPHGSSHRKRHRIVFDISVNITVQQRRHRSRHFAGRAAHVKKQAYRTWHFCFEKHDKKYSGKKN